MIHSFAIDLGSCTVSAAFVERGVPRVLYSGEDVQAIPSYVAFVSSSRVLIGVPAKRQAIMNPQSTLFGLKRLAGRRYDTPRTLRLRQGLPFGTVPSASGEVWLRVNGQDLAPEEVQAVLVHRMKRLAENYLGEEVTSAVMAIPAHFTESQRRAVTEAGRIAGLRIRDLVPEAVAAAVAAGAHEGDARYVAVCDLGGTFDLTLLRVDGGALTVCAAKTDLDLGGDAFDQRIVGRLCEVLRDRHGVDGVHDAVVLQRLIDVAEEAKRDLSRWEEVQVELPVLLLGHHGPLDLAYRLTRRELTELTKDLLDRLEEPCLAAVLQAGITPDEVELLVFSGAMTRSPEVRRRVEALFPRAEVARVSPEDAVVMGAALCADAAGDDDG